MFGIIVNPVSGGGKHADLALRIEKLLKERGEKSKVYQTQYEGDGTHQTQQAIDEGCDSIVCIGGDGTISEAVRAVAGSGKTFYIAPCGTGNDFARSLKLPKDPIAALLAQLEGTETAIDCGSINGRAFMNISGSGFDVEVLRKTEELKAVYPDGKAYRKAVLAVMSNYRAFEADISIDGGEFVRRQSTIIEVANGRYFGGGMAVAPGADYRDGLFDVVLIDRIPRCVIPFVLPLFILGAHVFLPIVRVVRAKKVVMRSKDMVVNIDGQLEIMDEAAYELLPGALKVRLTR